jgi:DNA-3-methyladenine glycosylase
VARDLLGCTLVSRSGGARTSGRIVETEAYLGPEDAASHAAIRPVVARHLFYGDGGHTYVFRIYGLHFCLNVITGRAGSPGCVLIRALEPLAGVRTMARRRGLTSGAIHGRGGPPAAAAAQRRERSVGLIHVRALTIAPVHLANGPGKLCEALAISSRHNGVDVTRGPLVIVPRPGVRTFQIALGPRVGITRATALPLRFWIHGNRYVSR